ncbi:conserved protein of unknown function [Tepidibacter aestuarii]|nr:conserved protein of unknown function [Tepidibacter aestuarii]
MNISVWIAIYMPIFILLFVILPQQRMIIRALISKLKKSKGVIIMTNELVKKYLGKNCHISTGTFGVNVVGKIINISENWIEIETKKGNELINSEFIQNIKLKSK